MSLARAVRVDARVRGDIIVMADLRVEPEFNLFLDGLLRSYEKTH